MTIILSTYGQSGKIDDSHFSEIEFYYDSVLIKNNHYWENPKRDQIVSYNDVRIKGKPVKDQLYITTKTPRNPASYKFLSFREIERIYTKSKRRSTLFMIRNQIITRALETYAVDSVYLGSVEVLQSTDVMKMYDKVSGFTILNILPGVAEQVRTNDSLKKLPVPKLYYDTIVPQFSMSEVVSKLPSQQLAVSRPTKEFCFLTLKEIERKYTGTVSATTLFELDGELLTKDLSTYLVDSSYIYKVSVLPSSDIEYLTTSLPVFTILRIRLATQENMTPRYYIRIY